MLTVIIAILKHVNMQSFIDARPISSLHLGLFHMHFGYGINRNNHPEIIISSFDFLMQSTNIYSIWKLVSTTE